MFVEAIRAIGGRSPIEAATALTMETAVTVRENPFRPDIKDVYRPWSPQDLPPTPEPLQVQMWAAPSMGQGQQMMVHFNSFAISGHPMRYEWDFGDGEHDYFGWSSTMHTYRARYQTPQPHTETFWARLRVQDEFGQETTSTQVITLWVPGTRNIDGI